MVLTRTVEPLMMMTTMTMLMMMILTKTYYRIMHVISVGLVLTLFGDFLACIHFGKMEHVESMNYGRIIIKCIEV
jgi:uncharacterized membrane protein YhhN